MKALIPKTIKYYMHYKDVYGTRCKAPPHGIKPATVSINEF